MDVTVEVVGEGSEKYSLAADATYDDLIREAGYHPQEASALVDGSPVPGDRVVDAEEVRLLRLIKGGAADGVP
jgi:sulfur carrier protein